MKTRSAIIYATGEPIRVEEVELDPPKEHEVLIRMVVAGVCHSDYHLVTGELPGYMPMALGHEGAGIVEAVGPNVTTCKPGDHVILSWIPTCGTCRYCVSGHSNLCQLSLGTLAGPLLDGTFRMHKGDTNIGQFCYVGTFSDRIVVPDISVVVIDQDYALNSAVVVGCGVLTGIGAVIHRAKIEPGSAVMVIGCGGIGMNIVQGAALAGARMIIAVDIHDLKLETAKQFGATHTINAKQADPVKTAMALTGGIGIDYSFDTSALPATIAQAVNALGKNGTAVLVGLASAAVQQIPISPLYLVLFQKTLMGTIYGDSQPRNDIPNLLAMYKAGKVKLDELVSRTYPLEQVNEAYADMIAGRIIRGVITFD